MAVSLAQRVASLAPSATVQNSDQIRSLRETGRRILSLSSGDPNLVTDERIVAAGCRALQDGDTHYTASAGLPRLRERLAARECVRSGRQINADSILITPGGKFALYAALQSMVDPGDEVLLPDPGWVSYAACVRLCGGRPVAVSSLGGFDLDELRARTTDRTRAIIVNSPLNPTGRVIPKEELSALADFARERGLWIVFDQVYCDLAYDEFPFLQAEPGLEDRLIVVDSFSKTFGMTGWRLGAFIGPEPVRKAVAKIIQHSIYCVPGFVQQAGLRALELEAELLPRYREHFHKRLVPTQAALARLAGWECPLPSAGFYLFPRITGDDKAFARDLLDTKAVAVMPGSAFGAAGAGHVRIALTCPEEEIAEAVAAIADFERSGNRRNV
nr:aminotransferase class I/II-fold pyridoxal phosphate-dependent enzyme [Rhodobium orientis]